LEVKEGVGVWVGGDGTVAEVKVGVFSELGDFGRVFLDLVVEVCEFGDVV
jgi:hypothetical protein